MNVNDIQSKVELARKEGFTDEQIQAFLDSEGIDFKVKKEASKKIPRKIDKRQGTFPIERSIKDTLLESAKKAATFPSSLATLGLNLLGASGVNPLTGLPRGLSEEELLSLSQSPQQLAQAREGAARAQENILDFIPQEDPLKNLLDKAIPTPEQNERISNLLSLGLLGVPRGIIGGIGAGGEIGAFAGRQIDENLEDLFRGIGEVAGGVAAGALRPNVSRLARERASVLKAEKTFPKVRGVQKANIEAKPLADVIKRGKPIKELKISKVDAKNIIENPKKAFDKITNKAIEENLKKIGPKVNKPSVFIENLQDSIKKSIKTQNKVINRLYSDSQKIIGNKKAQFPKTASEIRRSIKEAQSIFGKLGEPKKILKDMENFFVAQAEKKVPVVRGGKQFERTVRKPVPNEIKIKDAIKIKKDLNRLLDFEYSDPSKRKAAESFVKKVRKQLVDEIKQVMPEEARISFNEAERLTGAKNELLGERGILNLLNEKSDNLAKKIATNERTFKTVKDLLKDVKGADKVIGQLERLAVEESVLKSKGIQKSAFLESLGRDKSKIVKSIESISGRKFKADPVLKEVSDSFVKFAEEGKLPDNFIKSIDNVKRYNKIQNKLKKTPEGKRISKIIDFSKADEITSRFIDKNGAVKLKEFDRFLNSGSNESDVFRKIIGDRDYNRLKLRIRKNLRQQEIAKVGIEKEKAGRKIKPRKVRVRKPFVQKIKDFIKNPRTGGSIINALGLKFILTQKK